MTCSLLEDAPERALDEERPRRGAFAARFPDSAAGGVGLAGVFRVDERGDAIIFPESPGLAFLSSTTIIHLHRPSDQISRYRFAPQTHTLLIRVSWHPLLYPH